MTIKFFFNHKKKKTKKKTSKFYNRWTNFTIRGEWDYSNFETWLAINSLKLLSLGDGGCVPSSWIWVEWWLLPPNRVWWKRCLWIQRSRRSLLIHGNMGLWALSSPIISPTTLRLPSWWTAPAEISLPDSLPRLDKHEWSRLGHDYLPAGHYSPSRGWMSV